VSEISGVARVPFGARGKYSQWPPITGITNFKKNQFIEFLVICLNNLKLLSVVIFFFHLRYSFCCRSDSAAGGAAGQLAPFPQLRPRVCV
jgi:hypothetical protein